MGAPPACTPHGLKFSQFDVVFWKIWQNRKLAPPPTGDPGSAPAHVNIFLKFESEVSVQLFLQTTQGRIQDSPRRGRRPSRRGSQHTNLPGFAKKLHQIKKILVRTGAPPLDPPLQPFRSIYGPERNECSSCRVNDMASWKSMRKQWPLIILLINNAFYFTERTPKGLSCSFLRKA